MANFFLTSLSKNNLINYKGTKIFVITLSVLILVYSFGENIFHAGMYAFDEIVNEIINGNDKQNWIRGKSFD